ncbi:MAG: hemerythrin domain-containing protein [Chloroflexi bacterium]|nr:hemerythrin domain-containing protein [Chloroflexota bacterium]
MGCHHKESEEAIATGGSSALEAFRAAHRRGLAQIARLEAAAFSLASGQDIELRSTFGFFHEELELHFREEEQALFPALAQHIGWEGPLRAMMEEHRSFWKAVDALEEASQDLIHIQQATNIARHIVWLLRSHIQKEETMLLPLAEKLLGPEALAQVARDMLTLGKGVS